MRRILGDVAFVALIALIVGAVVAALWFAAFFGRGVLDAVFG